MILKNFFAILVLQAIISTTKSESLHQKMSHQFALDEFPRYYTREVGISKNLFSKQYQSNGYFISKIAGFNTAKTYLYPYFRLYRIELTFTSLDPLKGSFIQSIGGDPNYCRGTAGVVQFDYTKNPIKMIKIGYDKQSITSVQFETSGGLQSIGNGSQSQINQTFSVQGIIVGVSSQAGDSQSSQYAINTISFRYKTNPATINLNSMRSFNTEKAQLSSLGTLFDREYNGYYITKIVGYKDRWSYQTPYRLYRVDFTFSTISGLILSASIGRSGAWLQTLAGTINIDYTKNLISKIIVGFDQFKTLSSIEVITGDGVSQKIECISGNVTYTTFPINGYLTGIAGREGGDGIFAIQGKYKHPL